MLLRSLRLRNIRSYVDAAVDFPEGMTLLAGDIGSGKSTILLALEFALFGIQRGELSGSSLLRHGCRNGEVELRCEIAGKEVTIRRALKRSSNGVGQEAGSIAVDGLVTEATAVELKAKVLGLLNYPPGLLTKGKRPLFRYTVYTPQEEMKAILLESAEERLDTLRKLFDIDRQRRVRENGLNLIKELRKLETALLARIEELGKGVEDERQLTERQRALATELAARRKGLEEEERGLKEGERRLETQEKERFAAEERKKRLAVAQSKAEQLRQRLAELAAEEERTARQVEETERHLAEEDTDEEALAALKRRLDEQERKIRRKEEELLRQESEQQAAIARSERLVAAIDQLQECPTCRQEVDEGHKAHIRADEGKAIASARKRLDALSAVREELARHRKRLAEKQTELLQKERLAGEKRQKLLNLKALKERLQANHDHQVELRKQEQELLAQAKRLEAELQALPALDEEAYAAGKRSLEKARAAVGSLRVRLAELRKDEERVAAELARVAERKEALAGREAELAAARQRLAWLNKHLLGVSHAVEKALFSSVYGLFNEYFREWFGMLLEDESLSVRLDAEFSPVIVQDGYEASVEDLSGGERTSVALAYRLALNKAVNEFLASINTKELLILDEPTDGFSSEQLDRVREVLTRLRLRQVLIVSHESQMEGYVDHILTVVKEGHESRVSG